MRHTITLTVEIEADTADRRQVASELLNYITDMQDQVFSSAEVLPDGSEANRQECVLSVVHAEAEGQTITAGWAVK